MGLDVYLHFPGEEKDPKYASLAADIPSERYPDHLFKRNYLRSSYNGSGFNSVVGALCGGRDLYWVFEPIRARASDPYGGTFRPSDLRLRAARERAEALLEELRQAEPIAVEFIPARILRPEDGVPATDEDAMAVYRKEAKENAERTAGRDLLPFGPNYSKASGHFWFAPLTVRAAIPGRGVLGDLGLYLVIDTDLTSYIQSAEIVIEFLDEALAHPKRTISWSG